MRLHLYCKPQTDTSDKYQHRKQCVYTHHRLDTLIVCVCVLQYDDLQDSMTDALVNDKPQFVRLFTENGLNILEYLTYERLENLYQSLSSSTLAYTLLQRWLRERHTLTSSQACSPDSADEKCKVLQSPVTGPSSARGLSLFEVRGQRSLSKLRISHMLLFLHFPVL